MKRTHTLLLFLLGCILLAAPALAQTGGSYDLHWNVIPGGSGKMTGGPYTLTGSAGQPVASVTTGGTFAVRSGFWTFPTPAPGDVDGDGLVDVTDLLWLVYAFGTYRGDPGYVAAADFNTDDAVDVVDLLDIVYNFGYSAF